MKLKVGDLKPILDEWIVETIYPKSTNWQIFALSFVLSAGSARIEEQIKGWGGYLADKNGFIDLDKLMASLNTSLEKGGGSIKLPYIDWMLDKNDLDKLFEIAKRRAK